MRPSTWDSRQDTVILKYYRELGPDTLGERFNRHRRAVIRRYCRLVGRRQTRRKWAETELDFIRAHYHRDMSASQIAEALGNSITKNMVIRQAHTLGLRR